MPNTKHELVLLPGLVNDARLWRTQTDALGDIAHIHVIDISKHDSIAALADDVLSAAPERFALAGLSMGGYVALEIMRRAPERIAGLALCSTNARPDNPETSERRRQQILQAVTDYPDVINSLIPGMFAPTRVKDEALTGLFTDMALAVGAQGFARQQTAIMNRPDSRPSLKNIHCPTLILFGAHDQIASRELHQEMADAIPAAQLTTIDEAGHLSPIECPDAVTAALRRWLSRLEA